MTAATFRKLALALPEVREQSHMDHPDFRVGGKIFATLGYPDDSRAMVKLTVEQREVFTAACAAGFVPVPGGWGRRGATYVLLANAPEDLVEEALRAAWLDTAPKKLRAQLETR
jgi:hypothetical protein